MSNKPQEFNNGHIVEGCDRCNTIMIMLDQLMDEHPAVNKVGGKDLVTDAHNAMFKLYQRIGALDDE